MKKQWQSMEYKDADLFGTTLQKGSGRVDHYPTDSFSDDLAVDSKYTEKKSYSVSLATWNKLCEEVAQLDAKDRKTRIPLLSLHLQETHLVVLSYEDFSYFQYLAQKEKSLK